MKVLLISGKQVVDGLVVEDLVIALEVVLQASRRLQRGWRVELRLGCLYRGAVRHTSTVQCSIVQYSTVQQHSTVQYTIQVVLQGLSAHLRHKQDQGEG